MLCNKVRVDEAAFNFVGRESSKLISALQLDKALSDMTHRYLHLVIFADQNCQLYMVL